MNLKAVYFIIGFIIFAYLLHKYIVKKTTEHELNRGQYKETHYPEPNTFITILTSIGFTALLGSILYYLEKNLITIISSSLISTTIFIVFYIIVIRKIACPYCKKKMKYYSFTKEEKPFYYRYCDTCKLKYSTGIGTDGGD